MATPDAIKYVRQLQLRAVRGDRASQDALSRYTDKIAKQVNRQLRALERRGYDYGAYNTPTHFTETEYHTDRFKTAEQLAGDYYMMRSQTEVGLKFLNLQTSTVLGHQRVEEKRFQTFVDLGIVDENFSRRKFRNFLRFLGNEESRQILEVWSTSDKMVEVLFDAYNRKENTKSRMLSLFREFLSGESKMGIDTLFDRLGLDINDYRSTHW